MRDPVEALAERRTVFWARQRGLLVTKLNIPGQRHWPDQCFWLPGGKPTLIEFKRHGKKPRPGQNRNHEVLRGLGYDVFATDSYEAAINRIKGALEASQLPKSQR